MSVVGNIQRVPERRILLDHTDPAHRRCVHGRL